MEQHCKIKNITAEYAKAYLEWMYTPGNVFRCKECPERMGDWRGHEYPCCQQNCLVEVHCYPERLKW